MTFLDRSPLNADYKTIALLNQGFYNEAQRMEG